MLTTRVCWLAALTALAAAGCGSSADSGEPAGPGSIAAGGSVAESAPVAASVPDFVSNTAAGGETASRPVSPFDAAVTAELGFSIGEIGEIVSRRLAAEVSQCLEQAGWPGDSGSLIPPNDVVVPGQSDLDRLIAGFEASLTNGEVAADIAGPEQIAAQQDCLTEVTSTVRDPLAGAVALLAQGQADLNARVQSDQRWIDAQSAYVGCLDSLGLSEQDVQTASQDLVTRANEAVDRFVMGDAELDETRAVLDELSNDELASLGDARFCRSDFQDVERTIYAEVEQTYLDAHTAEFQAVLETATTELATFEAYFPK